MKKITPNLLQELQATVNPRLSSSGRYLCYTVKQCSQDLEGYSSKLFWMDLKTGQRQEIVSPHRTASGVWDKDTLFLVSPAGNGRTRWETWSPQDGRQERFELPVACGGGMFLNNGQLLVRAAQPKPDENGMPFVVEEYPYTSDGKGWTCGKQEALYLYDQEKKQLIKISPQDARIQLSYAWEDKIAFTGWLSKDSVCERPGLYVYCQRKGHWEQYLAPGKYYIRQLFALGHDLYFAGSDGSKYGRYEYTGFFRVDPQHSCADLFASYGNNVGLNSVLNDTFTDPGKKICTDGDALYFITSVHHRSGVKRLGADGTISDFLTQALTVESLDCANGTLVYCGSKQMHTPELYQVDQAGERCLAQAAQPQLECTLSIPEPVEMRDSEGCLFYGWVLKPVDWRADRTYPAVVSIHGGPRSAYGPIYLHELQCLAAQGYFVLYCNPRGSDTYGNEFGRINGLYGTVDMQNILQMLDTCVEKYPQIDGKRIGVSGGSYGGFMVNWLIGHTDRFAAAVAQRSISNWISQETLSDIGKDYVKDQMGISLLEPEGVQQLWERSPLRYAHKIHTPTLFLHSNSDMRCPLEEARQMFYILHNRGIPTRLVVFQGENHGLSRGGKPKNRIRRLEEICQWFLRYLTADEEAK